MADRDKYLQKLISKKDNGLVKVITGVRRCGKSYLLKVIFRNYLKSIGISEDEIVDVSLDEINNAKLRNPLLLSEYLNSFIKSDKKKYYFLLDEIQFVKKIDNPYLPGDKIGFSSVLIGLSNRSNCDVYVTGSNSKLLSKDIETEFRGKNCQIFVTPFSFEEYLKSSNLSKEEAFSKYVLYGGMPGGIGLEDGEREQYLKVLFSEIYFHDIDERYNVKRHDVLDNLFDYISSTQGNLINPNKVANVLNQSISPEVSVNTVTEYIKYLEESFLINITKRFDVRGKNYFSFPNKYYYIDQGLRNARLNFRQIDKGSILEEIVYNELIRRSYSVDIGVVEDKNRQQKEIDFVVNKMDRKYYIQCSWQIQDNVAREREISPLLLTNDFFKKIILRTDILRSFYDEKGVLNLNIFDFLLNEKSLEEF